MENAMPPVEIRLETERLILRPWRKSDAAALYKYAKDEPVGDAAGWPPHKSTEESEEVIRTVFSAPEIYAIVPKTAKEPVGCVGLVFKRRASMKDGDAEIGYWIGVPYWGRGLVPEAVACLLKRAFGTLGIDTVWCAYYEGNERSRRVAEKCGFRFHHVEEAAYGVAAECFTCLSREEWVRESPASEWSRGK